MKCCVSDAANVSASRHQWLTSPSGKYPEGRTHIDLSDRVVAIHHNEQWCEAHDDIAFWNAAFIASTCGFDDACAIQISMDVGLPASEAKTL